jgi:hypothetical protein
MRRRRKNMYRSRRTGKFVRGTRRGHPTIRRRRRSKVQMRRYWAARKRRRYAGLRRYLKSLAIYERKKRKSVGLPRWRSIPKTIRDIADAEIAKEFGGGRKRRRSRSRR